VPRRHLDTEKLQEICDLVADKVPCCISIMDSGGVIVASSNADRIGLPHEGAKKVLNGETDVFDVTAEEASVSETYIEGRILPLNIEGRREACIAVSAELEKAQDFASIAQTCVQALIDQDSPPPDQVLQTSPLFKAFFQQSYQFGGLMDRDGKVVLVNDHALEFMGASVEQIRGLVFWESGWIDLNLTEEIAKVRDAFFKTLEGKEQTIELYREREDTGRLISDLTFKPVADRGGYVTHVAVEVRDFGRYRKVAEELQKAHLELEKRVAERTADLEKQVRERKLVEAQLRDSELRFKQIAETASDWFWETDAAHRFTYISERFFELSGVDPATVIGRSRKEFIGPSLIAQNPEQWAKHFECLENHQAFTGFEYEIKAKGGAPFILQLSGQPVFDLEGSFRGYRGAGRDVTAERNAEKAHIESEKRFRDIAETASDWFWEMGPDLRFSYISNRGFAALNVEGEEIIGRTRQEVISSIGIDTKNSYWSKHFADLERRLPFSNFEYIVEGKDGERHWVSISGKPFFDENGSFLGYRGTARDVTELRRREEELRESQARLSDFLQTASDWVWEMGPDLRFTYLSGRGFLDRNIGEEDATAIGKTRRELLIEVGADVTTEAWKQHFQDLENRKPFSDFEYVVVDNDDIPRWVSISGKPIFNSSGRFIGYRGAARDVTELRQREEDLRESQACLSDFVDTASDWVWEMGPDLRFTFFSERIRDILGVPPEWTLGKTREEMGFPEEDREAWEKHLEDLKFHRPFKDFKYRYRHPSGEDRFLCISGKPVFDRDGSFKGYRGTGSNITEEVIHRRALIESERRFRSLAENSTLGVLVHLDFQLLFANDSLARMLGYNSVDDVLKLKQVEKLFSPDEASRITKYKDERMAGREAPESYDAKALKKDGTELWVNNHAFIIEWEGQTCICTTLLDISDQREAAETLKRAKEAADTANRAKSDFLARMSHELRTPLNSIIGLSEMLLEESIERQDENYMEPLRRINRSGDHLLGLINDVLDISKIEAGRMDLHLEEFNVSAIIDQVKSTTGPLAEKKGNVLIIACDPALATMYGDPIRVRQLLINLLSNASKFTENGEIRIEARREVNNDDAFVVFEVHDTGIGIDPEKIPHLFEDFTQADSATTRKFGGTGLGLAICRRLCALMGGTISVASELGVGALFTVRIPERIRYVAGENKWPQNDKGVTKRILVIDSDVASQKVVAQALYGEGYDIFFAQTGEDALRLANEIEPAFITLDVHLSDMDGWEVLTLLKKSRSIRDVPVVITTVQGNEARAIEMGATDYLVKPIDTDELNKLASRYCSGCGKRSVLVIDDESDARLIIGNALERSGYAVLEADSGKQAFAALENDIPSLITLDLMMPEMDGFDFLTNLRSNLRWAHIPVLVVTAKELTKQEKRQLTGRIEGVLQKGETMGHGVRDRLIQRVVEIFDMEEKAP